MVPLTAREFDEVYQRQVKYVLAHWSPDMQQSISRHNHGWREGAHDFQVYLRASSVRFYHAYRLLVEHAPGIRVCDVGGFWGVLPLTLGELGFDVTMTEALEYYDSTFDSLFAAVEQKGVKIVDYDPFDDKIAEPFGKFDFVTVMAVLEHFPHSLQPFMQNALSLLNPKGNLYLEVPNISFWPKRFAGLLGSSPLVPVTEIYKSAAPFIGHHHEFTIGELRDLAHINELSVVAERFYDYSPMSFSFKLRSPVRVLMCGLFKNCRECLGVLCKRESAGKGQQTDRCRQNKAA